MESNTMPATEAQSDAVEDINSYECAFHILPTIAEGEVEGVFAELKTRIEKHDGVITDEEVPASYNLAYEITKSIDGAYQRFVTSYFGWVRFTLSPEALAELEAALVAHENVLRCMVVRLTREDEARPFRVFDAALVADAEEDVADATEEDVPAEDAEKASE